MKKGIVFNGCSYTWGEGLYFYSGLDNLPFNENHQYYEETVTHTMSKYREKYRFPRLVADYFNTWEYIPNDINGGSILKGYSQSIYGGLYNGEYKYSDFNYFVWQLSDPIRDFAGGHHKLANFYGSEEESIMVYNEHIKRLISIIDNTCDEWESRGITPIIVSWLSDFIEHENVTEKFKKRYCNIEYKNKIYNSFQQLYTDTKLKYELNNPSLTIRDDFFHLNLQKNDYHLNKLGHRIVADSIIKKIKEYE